MNTAPLTTCPSEEMIHHYQENGFVIVRKLFSKDRIRAFKTDVITRVQKLYPKLTDGVPVFFLDGIPEPFLKFCCCPELTGIVHQLLGPRIEFLSVKPVYKNGSVTFPSAWHQDYAYWKGSNKLSIWIALDDATVENGCLRFLPGAHGKLLDHSHRSGTFGNYLDESGIDQERVVDAPMSAGDACFFHDLAPHASHPNTSGQDRWSFIPTYRNADEPDSSEVWKTSKRIDQTD